MFRLFSSLTIRPRCLKRTRWVFPILVSTMLVLTVEYGPLILSKRSESSKAPARYYNNDDPIGIQFPVVTTPPIVSDENSRGDLQYKDFQVIFNHDDLKSKTRLSSPVKRVRGFGDDIQLFSAIAGNVTTNSTWDKLAITGWEAGYLHNRSYSCCVAFSSGAIQSFPATKLSYSKMCPFVARQFLCQLGENNSRDIPMAATIADSNNPICHRDLVDYVDIEYAYKRPEEIAVFEKLLFGNISAHDLVAWIEIHKLQGASKFVVYCRDLNTDALKVLQYYERSGLLDLIPLRSFPTGLKTFDERLQQLHSDQEVSMYDALQRLKGYKYVTYFDTDEYILSRKGEPWMTVFDRMFNSTPGAGSFWFPTYLFTMSWGPSGSDSPFRVVKYLLRTERIINARKYVYIPNTVKDIGIVHHHARHIDGYISYNATAGDTAIHHYRVCRPKWLNNPGTMFPCFNMTRVHDETVLNTFRLVEKNVLSLWTADLSINRLFMESVADTERRIVLGVQTSLNQLMDMLKFAMVMAAPEPELFGILVIISFVFVSVGWALYANILVQRHKTSVSLRENRGVMDGKV